MILGEIRRLFRDGGAVKVSRLIKERSLMVTRAAERFESQNGRSASLDELAEICGLERQDVIEAIAVSSPTVSLTATSDDGELTQLDLPVDPPDIKITDELALNQALSTLDERDRQLIFLRFYKNLTQQQTAQRLGMTQVQVSRREKKVLGELREKLG